MAEVICAFLWAEGIEESSDPSPRRVDGALVGFAEEGFELGEDHFDWVKVGAIGWQEQQMRARVSDELAGRLTFVAAEIVGNHDVARCQDRGEALADPGGESVSIDRPVQHEGGYDAVVAQPGEEGQSLPVPVRNMCDQATAPRGPAAGPGHVGLHPRFIYENQSLGVKPMLVRLPPGPEPRHLRAKLFSGHQRFFLTV